MSHCLWVIGLGTLAFGVVLLVRGKDESDGQGKWGQEQEPAPMADQTSLVEEDSREEDNGATNSSDGDDSSGSNQDGVD